MTKIVVVTVDSVLAIHHFLTDAEADAFVLGYRAGRMGKMDGTTIKKDGVPLDERY